MSFRGMVSEGEEPLFPHGDFSRLSQTSDLKIGEAVTLPGTWC